jgi:hypothetical protein
MESLILRGGNQAAAMIGTAAILPIFTYASLTAAPAAVQGAATALLLGTGGKHVVDAAARKDAAGVVDGLIVALSAGGSVGQGLGAGPRAGGRPPPNSRATGGAAGGKRAGKRHTPAAKRKAREEAGPDCPNCGTTMTEPTRRTKGGTVDPAEAQGDHILPKSKGGDGATVDDQRNIKVICATCNNKKSDRIE